ncbi:hypothetical protein D3C75_754440 [compost metagenome]
MIFTYGHKGIFSSPGFHLGKIHRLCGQIFDVQEHIFAPCGTVFLLVQHVAAVKYKPVHRIRTTQTNQCAGYTTAYIQQAKAPVTGILVDDISAGQYRETSFAQIRFNPRCQIMIDHAAVILAFIPDHTYAVGCRISVWAGLLVELHLLACLKIGTIDVPVE